MEIVALMADTTKFLKMKEHLPFCRETSVFFIEDRVALTMLSNFERVAALLSFLMGSVFDP